MQAYDAARDVAVGQQAAQNWLAQAKNYGRDNGAYGDEARNNQAKQQLAASRFAQLFFVITSFGWDVKPRSSLCSTPNMDLKDPDITEEENL